MPNRSALFTYDFFSFNKIAEYMELKLEKLSEAVFPLPPEHLSILKFLAINGPSNVNSIVKFVQKKFPELGWEGIQNKITGTKRNQGLFLTEYISETKKKGRYNKPEYTYFLLSKGIIASIQSIPLSKNYFFQKVLKVANENTKGSKHPNFIREYITTQIKLFLAYHSVEGIQLTWQTNATLYYRDFFHNLNGGISLLIKNKKIFNEFKKIVEDYVILHSTYEYLNGKPNPQEGVFPSLFYYTAPEPRFPVDKKNWNDNVYNWYIGLWQTVLKDPDKDVKLVTHQRDLEYSTDQIAWGQFSPQVKKKLGSLGVTDIKINRN